MSSIPFPGADCGPATPPDSQRRKRTHGSITNLRSHKRRRISLASGDVSKEFMVASSVTNENARIGPSVDRHIPPRPNVGATLNASPRSRKLSKKIEPTLDDRVFNFRRDDRAPLRSSNSFQTTLDLLRQNAANLFREIPTPRSSSVIENLNKRRQCLLTLDSPGIPKDTYAFPISWSNKNLIAVSCGRDVFYQNLTNKTITHLCKVETPRGGTIHAIEWAGKGRDTLLATGNMGGAIQVWDAGGLGAAGTLWGKWQDNQDQYIRSMSWLGDVLAVGVDDGAISLIDIRAPDAWNRTRWHKNGVIGLKWSPDGNYLASGDEKGSVQIWDKRAGKSLLDIGKRGSKMKHQSGVKAIAWCPWKPDLLATGTTPPEGKIRIWSTNKIFNNDAEPLDTYPLNTSVLSLHWSPHAKELLSTHGVSFLPISKRERLQDPTGMSVRINHSSPLTNSIVVHDYPSGKRLLTLTNAHLNPVTHSCLSPAGDTMFTVCPGEETIKMWQVWSPRKVTEKRESAFDKCLIR